jgi:hypothetical protein
MREATKDPERHSHHAVAGTGENSLTRYRWNQPTRGPSTASLRADNSDQDDSVKNEGEPRGIAGP